MKRLILLGGLMALLVVGSPVEALTLSGTFTDDDGNVHEANIQAIADAGLTNGCGGSSYCPTAVVTREQMASFLVRALGLQPLSSGPFSDLLPNVHAGDINAIAAAGITLGCDTNRFCPTDPVARDQMASFIARAFELAAAGSFGFTDVSSANPHRDDINAIAAAGITVGCDSGLYCPSNPVLRDQMASFLARSLELSPVFIRLPLFDGLPLTCTKDGLLCTGTISIPYRPIYEFEESLYQITPADSDELTAFNSADTRVDLVVDGRRFALTAEDSETVGARLIRPFTSALTLFPGTHNMTAQWFLDGSLIQTVDLTVVVG